MKYEILKKGRKWFEAVELGKTFKVQIEINEISKNWEVGSVVDVHGEVKKTSSSFGVKVQIFPTSLEQAQNKINKEKEEKKLNEIKRWLGYIIDKAENGAGWIYKNGIDKCNELGIKDYPDLFEEMNKTINKVTEYKENQKQAKEESQRKENEIKQKIKEERIDKIVNDFFNKISELSYEEVQRIFNTNELGEATSKVAKILEEKGIIQIFNHYSGYDDFENDSGFVSGETSYIVNYKKLREVYPFFSSDEIQIEKENKTIKAYKVKENKEKVIELSKELKKLEFSYEHTTHYLDKNLNIWFTYRSYDNGSNCSFINFDALSIEHQELIKTFYLYQSEIEESKKIAREIKEQQVKEKRIQYEQEKKDREIERLRKEEELRKKEESEKILKDNKLNNKINYESEHLKKRSDDEIKAYLLSTHKNFKIKEIEIKTFIEGANIVYAKLYCDKKKQKYVYFENFNEKILIDFAKENDIEI